ncbi:uncharacterized protein LOC120158302 [Hibiscus syriacus]|uniref:uncharacterized protein LOC120158302 n=1 Tax=Hibiscus syriacus TaxID=106335 RepID=UPI0019216D7E|nr:uncharacterized protein LOC120158302 [Hibiscus syriacus]
MLLKTDILMCLELSPFLCFTYFSREMIDLYVLFGVGAGVLQATLNQCHSSKLCDSYFFFSWASKLLPHSCQPNTRLGCCWGAKTKPTQHSVRELRALGLTPHLLACRSAQPLLDNTKQKLQQFCHVPVNLLARFCFCSFSLGLFD